MSKQACASWSVAEAAFHIPVPSEYLDEHFKDRGEEGMQRAAESEIPKTGT